MSRFISHYPSHCIFRFISQHIYHLICHTSYLTCYLYPYCSYYTHLFTIFTIFSLFSVHVCISISISTFMGILTSRCPPPCPSLCLSRWPSLYVSLCIFLQYCHIAMFIYMYISMSISMATSKWMPISSCLRIVQYSLYYISDVLVACT